MKLARLVNLVLLQAFLARRGRQVLLSLAVMAALGTLGRAFFLTIDRPLSTELITAQESQPNHAAFQALQDSIDRAQTRATTPLPSLRNPFQQP